MILMRQRAKYQGGSKPSKSHRVKSIHLVRHLNSDIDLSWVLPGKGYTKTLPVHGQNIGVPFLFLSLLKYILSHPCNPLPKQELKVSINSLSQVQASRNIFTGAAATFTHTAPSICDKLVAVHDTCIDTALKTAGVLAWPRDPKTIFLGVL